MRPFDLSPALYYKRSNVTMRMFNYIYYLAPLRRYGTSKVRWTHARTHA